MHTKTEFQTTKDSFVNVTMLDVVLLVILPISMGDSSFCDPPNGDGHSVILHVFSYIGLTIC